MDQLHVRMHLQCCSIAGSVATLRQDLSLRSAGMSSVTGTLSIDLTTQIALTSMQVCHGRDIQDATVPYLSRPHLRSTRRSIEMNLCVAACLV